MIPVALSDDDATARFATTGSAYTGHLLAGNGATINGEIVCEIETMTLDRLLQRDEVDALLATRMLAVQADRRARLAIADDVLVNEGTLAALQPHVASLDAQYRALSASTRAS